MNITKILKFHKVVITGVLAVTFMVLPFTSVFAGGLIDLKDKGIFPSFPQAPEVITLDATRVTANGAVLNASFDGNGSPTDTWFTYGKTNTFGETTPVVSRGTGSGEFSQTITGLEPDTKYYFKAVAINEHGATNGGTLSFTTLSDNNSDAPEVTTKEATNISETQAILRASFDGNGSPTEVWFQYGKTNTFGKTTPVINYGSGTGDVSQLITGLESNTKYYFKAVAINENDVTNGSTLSFTTTTYNNPGQVPEVTTKAAIYVEKTQAVLNASFDSNGSSTDVWFRYGKTISLGKTTSAVSRGSGSGNFSQLIVNLESNTPYYFQAVAINENGVAAGSILSFTTKLLQDQAPRVITNSASGVKVNKAVLNGSVDPNGRYTTAYFKYGTSASNLSRTVGTQGIGSGNSYVNVSYSLSGLAEQTKYYFKICAENSVGTSCGSIKNFTTNPHADPPPADTPTVTTTVASSINKTSVTLNGIIDPNGDDTKGWFEYDTSVDLGSTTETKSLGSGSKEVALSIELTDLEAGTIYYFRAVAKNDAGIERGKIKIFKTGSTTFTTTTVSSSDNAESSSLVSLKIETLFEEMAVGDIVEYTITYKNKSSQDLKDAILRVILPAEISFRKATAGSFSSSDHALIVNLETLEKDQEGKVHLQAQIGSKAEGKDLLVITALLVFSEEDGTQDQAIAYVLHNMKTGEKANLLGAAAIFGGGFLPNTLAGWLVVLLILSGLVFLGQHLYKTKIGKGKKVIDKGGNADDDEISVEKIKQSFNAFNNRQQINK